MKRSALVLVIVLIALPLSVMGCKGKVEKLSEEPRSDIQVSTPPVAGDTLTASEPAQSVATETIPPTAASQIAEKPAVVAQEKEKSSRNKDIQAALKNAGFYTGSIDGKIGPKTKNAIEQFQKSKGLKADGKVGPKTWAEMEKYLSQ